jgi:hypothetical protein
VKEEALGVKVVTVAGKRSRRGRKKAGDIEAEQLSLELK